jgi:hypothetical protein
MINDLVINQYITVLSILCIICLSLVVKIYNYSNIYVPYCFSVCVRGEIGSGHLSFLGKISTEKQVGSKLLHRLQTYYTGFKPTTQGSSLQHRDHPYYWVQTYYTANKYSTGFKPTSQGSSLLLGSNLLHRDQTFYRVQTYYTGIIPTTGFKPTTQGSNIQTK